MTRIGQASANGSWRMYFVAEPPGVDFGFKVTYWGGRQPWPSERRIAADPAAFAALVDMDPDFEPAPWQRAFFEGAPRRMRLGR